MFSLFDKVFGRRGDYDDDYEDFDEMDEMMDTEDEVQEEVRPRMSFGTERMRSRQMPQQPQSRVVDMRSGNPVGRRQEVIVIEPKDLAAAQRVCDDLRSGRTVICNIEKIDELVSQRVIDYITGAAYALSGNVTAISRLIFVVTPANTMLRDTINQRQPQARDPRRVSRYNPTTEELLRRVVNG